jgi:Domain of unknown function (DUF5666)
MRRVIGVFVGALLLSALPAFAQADKPAAKPEAPKADAAKGGTANGTVSAVTADSLTVKAKDGEMTFAIDSATKVQAKGASHKSDAMKDDKKPTQVTDFVKVGDTVSVKYSDMGGKMHASNVTVRAAAPPAK